VALEGSPRLAEGEPKRGASIVVSELTKRYSSAGTTVTALEAVSFSVPAGGLLAVMGPSGSGKSTLLHVLGAMDTATSGHARVDQHAVTELRRSEQTLYRRQIGFVFQRFHLLSALTALDNVAAPVLPYRTDFDKHKRAAGLLRAVGLDGREAAFPSELSGGQQQRVAIARALINDPVLLLADEPTGNLDSQTGAEIFDLLLDLRERREMTVIIATHDTLVASRCDRIVRLLDGRMRDEVGSPSPMPAETLGRIQPSSE
jgi:putative ABC transport system ATP-binding protein